MENYNIADTCNADAERPLVLERASVAARLGAFMIDHVILTLLTFILIIPVMQIRLILFGHIDANPDRMFSIAFVIMMFIAFFIYCLKDIIKGRSLGKRALGIAVRNRSDMSQIPSAGRLFLRNVFTFLWPLDFLVLVCSADRTKIGDKIAGTDVYRVSKRPRTLIIIIAIILAFAVFMSTLNFAVRAIIRNHPSYQAALHYIETNPRVVELVGDVLLRLPDQGKPARLHLVPNVDVHGSSPFG